MVFRDVRNDGSVRLTGAIPGVSEPIPGPEPEDPYDQVFNFAVASVQWDCVHNQAPLVPNVEIYDSSGYPVEADVYYLNANTVRILFYFPMTGYARLHD